MPRFSLPQFSLITMFCACVVRPARLLCDQRVSLIIVFCDGEQALRVEDIQQILTASRAIRGDRNLRLVLSRPRLQRTHLALRC